MTDSFSFGEGLYVIHEQWRAGQSDRAAAERVFERHRIMNFERDHAVGADALEHAGDVSGGHRIVRLGAAVFARVTKIRRHRGDARGAGILDCADEEQQPAQLVVGALLRPAVQALYDIDIGAVYRIERTRFVLAVLEFALFMRGERLAQGCRNSAAQVLAGSQRKNP